MFLRLACVLALLLLSATTHAAPIERLGLTISLPEEASVKASESSNGTFYILNIQRTDDDGKALEEDSKLSLLRYVQTFQPLTAPSDLLDVLARDIDAALQGLELAPTEPVTITRSIAGGNRIGRQFSFVVPDAGSRIVEYFVWSEPTDNNGPARTHGLIYKLPEQDADRDAMVAVVAGLKTSLVDPMAPMSIDIVRTSVKLPALHRIAETRTVPITGASGLDVRVETASGSLLIRAIYAPHEVPSPFILSQEFYRAWRDDVGTWSQFIAEAGMPIPVEGGYSDARIRWARVKADGREAITVGATRNTREHMLGLAYAHPMEDIRWAPSIVRNFLHAPPGDRSSVAPPRAYLANGLAWMGLSTTEPIQAGPLTGPLEGATSHWMLNTRFATLDARLKQAIRARDPVVRRVIVPSTIAAADAAMLVEADLLARFEGLLGIPPGESEQLTPLGLDGEPTTGRLRIGFVDTELNQTLAIHTSAPTTLPDGRLVIHQLVVPSFTRGYADHLLAALSAERVAGAAINDIVYGPVRISLDHDRDVVRWTAVRSDAPVDGSSMMLRRDEITVQADRPAPRADNAGLSLDALGKRLLSSAVQEFPKATLAGQSAVFFVNQPATYGDYAVTTVRFLYLDTNGDPWVVRVNTPTREPEEAQRLALEFIKAFTPVE